MKGFAIKTNYQEDYKKYVSKCFQGINIQLEYNGHANIIVEKSNNFDIFINESFIFGIYDETLKEILDLPIVVAKVSKREWVTVT